MALVCKICGYKQCDEETIKNFKCLQPNKEEHDITYYCGACMDNASDNEYDIMQYKMHGGE